MGLMNKIRCLFNQEYCEVPDADDEEFERRTEQMMQQQEEVETRLRALGTTVDVTLLRDHTGEVSVRVQRRD